MWESNPDTPIGDVFLYLHMVRGLGLNLEMGKRKSRAKPPPKKRMDKLDTVFSCPFCNHGSSVECRIDMKNLIGEAVCGICQESFSMTITGIFLSQGMIMQRFKAVPLNCFIIWKKKVNFDFDIEPEVELRLESGEISRRKWLGMRNRRDGKIGVQSRGRKMRKWEREAVKTFNMLALVVYFSTKGCDASYDLSLLALTEPIDIYSEWIDECERVNTLEDDGA
ncbi:hypothetical protein DKX38_025591 [Salix brachista]|uniref:Transcription elongation factor 1 homolog n=1 Tax=Salix brachista TaxID=2182728 RepID=A0A5N5JQ54_9ROSI|nr:hypothetical protein DKX38_025591 [Salix brachista]